MESEKHTLRQRCRELLKSSPELQPGTWLGHLRDLEHWGKARTILAYAPLPGEPDLLSLLDSEPNKGFVFPKIEGEFLGLYRWLPETRWAAGPFGLSEPDPDHWPPARVQEIDLALIPGLAFDQLGKRLGRGRGFYDRLLASPDFRALRVGITKEALLLPEVPAEPHDVPVDLVVTETRVLVPPGSRLDNGKKRG